MMETDRLTGSTPLMRLMQRLGVPVTRQSYLDISYMGEPPAEPTASGVSMCVDELS
jgi:hypothetical protein